MKPCCGWQEPAGIEGKPQNIGTASRRGNRFWILGPRGDQDGPPVGLASASHGTLGNPLPASRTQLLLHSTERGAELPRGLDPLAMELFTSGNVSLVCDVLVALPDT